MDKQKRYGHLSPEERAVLQIEVERKTSLRKIAAMLRRSHSTLSREIRRNLLAGGAAPSVAGKSYQAAEGGRRYADAPSQQASTQASGRYGVAPDRA